MFQSKLAEQYESVGAALPDVIVATEVTGIIHQPDGDEPDPWCKTPGSHFEFIQTADAQKWGGELCEHCFAGVLRHLADDPASPVERLEQLDATPDTSDVPVATPDGGSRPGKSAPLSSMTERVALPRGDSRTYHAPQASGETICGRVVDDVIERGRAPRAVRPCRECFDSDVIDD